MTILIHGYDDEIKRDETMVLEEIFIANGASIIMMAFLLDCRRRNRESIHVDDRIYDWMAIVTFLGAAIETLSFIIDRKSFAGARVLNYLTNSLCYLGTSAIGFLWCLYVDLHIYKNHARYHRNIRIVAIPLLLELGCLLYNLFRNGFMFSVSADNVYSRGTFSIIGYMVLYIYFIYSIYLVYRSKRDGVNLDFFPIFYFVGPCVLGVVIQFLRYGITCSWISVAISLTFVQMQVYSENISTDSLSGLYNRRYLDCILARKDRLAQKPIYGIMMDVNDFKEINDRYGHSMGDQAIRVIGNILAKSLPDGGIPIRYAGDEFVALLICENPNAVFETMTEINRRLDVLNRSGAEPFKISVSMGQAKLDPNNSEIFLREMDERMYEEKRRYHQLMHE